MAQNLGLKQIQTVRNDARKKEKPRFIIKALDPKEFLSTSIAEVDQEDTEHYRKEFQRSKIRNRTINGNQT